MKNRIKLNVEHLKMAIAEKQAKKGELALAIGVTRETLSRWIAGRIEYIDQDRLTKLSEILECELSWLSPEIAPFKAPASITVEPSQVISGDDLMRLGLYSGLWNEISNLHRNAQSPTIVEDVAVNLALFHGLAAITNLDFTSFLKELPQANPIQLNHELFDVIARHGMAEGILLMAAGDLNAAQRQFKRVMIQGQSDWLIAFAQLLSAFCQLPNASTKDVEESLKRGLTLFSSGSDDLTNFFIANIHLILTYITMQRDGALARGYFQEAKQRFDRFGYRFSHARCLCYEAYLLMDSNKAEALSKAREALSGIRRMPRLYQLEALAICSQIFKNGDDADAAGQYLEMADEMAKQSPILSFFMTTVRIHLDPHSERLKMQCESLRNSLNSSNHKLGKTGSD